MKLSDELLEELMRLLNDDISAYVQSNSTSDKVYHTDTTKVN